MNRDLSSMTEHCPATAGFTLIETLVALTLLTVGIIPLLSLAFSSISVADSIRNNMIAANLAQEGIEVVRAVRDTNWLAGDPPFDTAMTEGEHQVAWDDTAVTAAYGDEPLKIDGDGAYNYADGTDTIFKRKVTLTRISASQMRVVSEVTWTERDRDRSVAVEGHLFDWNQ